MAASADKGMVAGAFYAQIALRNSSGYPMGQDTTPNTVSNGDVKHAYKIKGFVSVDAPQIQTEIAIRKGGQKVLGQRALGVSSFGSFTLTLSDYDETFHNIISGATIDTTLASNWATTSFNALKATRPQLILLVTAGIQNDSGVDQFLHMWWHNVTIQPVVPGVTQSGGDNPNALAYTVTPSTSLRAGWGSLFSATTLALEDNSDIVSFQRTDTPISFSTYIDDGAATSTAVFYRPLTSENAGADNVFLKNGVPNHTGVSDFNTTTGATTHTAGTGGDIWTIIYGTNFVPV